MTPKDKAKELVERFFLAIKGHGQWKLSPLDHRKTEQLEWAMWGKQSKACALISVEEIINAEPTEPTSYKYYECRSDIVEEATEYWQQVKTEIEKL